VFAPVLLLLSAMFTISNCSNLEFGQKDNLNYMVE
jgi:hypothetical protein